MRNSSVDKLRQPRSNANTLRPDPIRDPNSFRIRSPGVVSVFGSLGRMSTLLPFPDLNLMPDSQSSTAGTTAGDTVVTGKLEVKSEPIEEWQTPPSSTSDQSANTDLIAEFIRISELFRSAFKPLQVKGLDGVSVYGLDSGAIVAVPEEENRELIEPPPGFKDNRVSTAVVSPKFERPRELARIAILGHEQRKELRQVMKRTRMTYESLRIHLMAESMKNHVLGQGRRRRSDMAAAYIMRDRGLCAVMRFAQTLRNKPLMVRPTGYVSFDLSNKKENVPVFLYNDVDGDQEPRHYEYIAKAVFPPGIFGQGGISRTGCECKLSCTDDCLCARKNGDQWRNWGDLSQVYPDFVRPNYPSLPPLDFSMDVSRMRNVACYISHSKEPNVMVQFVLHDHNHLMFPRVMLFALENISPLAELSLDYGLADEVNGKLAICN
ncbi:unnamed protein product [Arabidopsis thaliana]|uniref:(thale cress) hypothetical protein n=1 Tax=Arabidopsis thaliana TaxID=3702 RepID=A0A7G2EE04_ARATH|nr:unnamed protein product [Arabidopsis thaliana]